MTEVLENGVSYKLKRTGSGEQEVKVHVDDMNSFKRWSGAELREAEAYKPELKSEASSTKKKYGVAEIMDEKDRETDHHQYLVRWGGRKENGEEWECSWRPATDLDCHLLIMEWEMTTAQQKGRKRKRAKEMGVAMQVESREMVALQQDILQLVMQSEKGTVIQQVCDKLGIDINEVLFVWASPPCETYTRLDVTNASRGNEHRDHSGLEKEPRSIESCHSEADFEKRKKAIDHDRMLCGLIAGFIKDNRLSHCYSFAVENPQGMLAERPFMQTDEWCRLVHRQMVHYCNYGGRFWKPTHIWTSLRGWLAGGKSGTGQCCQECQVGRWKLVDKAIRKTGIQYVHDNHIGGSSEKMSKTSKGEKNQKCQRWEVPHDLLTEIMAQARKEGSGSKKYVINLFLC